MKIREFKKLLDKMPSDMEILIKGDMGQVVLEMDEINVALLDLVQYDEWNGKPYAWNNWEYPENYKRNVIRSETVLLLG